MTALSSAELRSAIDSKTFSVKVLTQLGRFPELVLLNGRLELARIACLAYDRPCASVVDEKPTIVLVSGVQIIRNTIEIRCRDNDEADLIAGVLDKLLREAYEPHFGKK